VRFQNFWPIVEPRRRNKGDIRMPFHALATDGVWSVFDADGRPSRARVTSTRAKLPDDLHALFGDDAFRLKLRRLLVAVYFPPIEQVALLAALGLEPTVEAPELNAVGENSAIYHAARETGRSARFKSQVVTGYRFTCALTGYRLTTIDQIGIVEAAHIHALRRSRNNAADNGLALTTAHVLFDLGLWSATDDLRVIVKPESAFAENSPAGGFRLRALAGASLHFAGGASLRPNALHLRWHREHHKFV
jgi:putative restriction endonuclease